MKIKDAYKVQKGDEITLDGRKSHVNQVCPENLDLLGVAGWGFVNRPMLQKLIHSGAVTVEREEPLPELVEFRTQVIEPECGPAFGYLEVVDVQLRPLVGYECRITVTPIRKVEL